MSNQIYIHRIGSSYDNGFKIKRKRWNRDEKQQEKFNQHLQDENKQKEKTKKSITEDRMRNKNENDIMENEMVQASANELKKDSGVDDNEKTISIFV